MTEKAKTLDSFCGRATFVPFLTPEDQSLKEVRPSIGCSVTRFGEILPLWKIFKSLWEIFGMVYFEFGKQLYLLYVTFYATKQIFIVVNGQRLNN